MSSASSGATFKRCLLSMAVAVFFGGAASAADTPAPPPAQAENSIQVAGDQAPVSLVDDLHRLIDSHQLVELRTTFNSSYGASLLFQADQLNYYVVLFHGKDFWRVIRTDSSVDAESTYHAFVTQTEELGKVDIEAARLQATKQYTDRLVAINQQRLQGLERDAAYQQQQSQQVAAQLRQSQQNSSALNAGLHASNSELEAIQERVRILQEQQSNPSLPLPSPVITSPSPDAIPAAPSPAGQTATTAQAAATHPSH